MPVEQSGRYSTSTSSVLPSGQFSTMSFRGASMAIMRGARALRSSRTQCSSMAVSTTESALATPTRFRKSSMDSGVYPLRRSAHRVGMRGSSQPATYFSSTRRRRYRLLMTVLVMLSRANSICLGLCSNSHCSMTQLYSGLWASYSREQRECVTPSMASCMGWAKSYMG